MEAMTIDFTEYRRRVQGCWLGKSVGGTLGGPYEGNLGPLSLDYYNPVPTEMLPNDDLDLQVVWLQTVRRRGLPVNRLALAEAWIEHVHLWPDEYGVAVRNIVAGINPPASGSYDNPFVAGMGAAIRTELWACLTPGDPDLAASLATEDACADHDGEGIYAAVFLAAIESLAFVERDRDRLLSEGLSRIPNDSRLARAIRDTRDELAAGRTALETRKFVVDRYGTDNWTDVVVNLAFIVIGWIAGDGDFGESLCTAVNCGFDTDCTGATLGAILGILAPEGIDEKWLAPIGRELVLSPGMVGLRHPQTLDELTDSIADLAPQVMGYYRSRVTLLDAPRPTKIIPTVVPGDVQVGYAGSAFTSRSSLLAVEPLIVSLTYPPNFALAPGQTAAIGITIIDPVDSADEVGVRFRLPDGWSVPQEEFILQPRSAQPVSIEVAVVAPAAAIRPYRDSLDITLRSGNRTWTLTAGLPMTIPWVRTTESAVAEVVHAHGHVLEVPHGKCTLQTNVKVPYRGTFIYVTQGTRAATTFLDGEEIGRFDGGFYVPAMHRSMTGVEVDTARGIHRVRIEVEPGPQGELFFGIGERARFSWVTDVEWSLPKE